MQRRHFIRMLSGSAVTTLGLGLAGCVSYDTYPPAPARPYPGPYYDYWYYPDVNVYFGIATGYYWYYGRNRWYRVRKLPPRYRLRRDRDRYQPKHPPKEQPRHRRRDEPRPEAQDPEPQRQYRRWELPDQSRVRKQRESTPAPTEGNPPPRAAGPPTATGPRRRAPASGSTAAGRCLSKTDSRTDPNASNPFPSCHDPQAWAAGKPLFFNPLNCSAKPGTDRPSDGRDHRAPMSCPRLTRASSPHAPGNATGLPGQAHCCPAWRDSGVISLRRCLLRHCPA